MKISTYHSYDELPLFLNAELVAKVLGVSISSAYELMHEEVFPSVRIGSRFVVPKDKFTSSIVQMKPTVPNTRIGGNALTVSLPAPSRPA